MVGEVRIRDIAALLVVDVGTRAKDVLDRLEGGRYAIEAAGRTDSARVDLTYVMLLDSCGSCDAH